LKAHEFHPKLKIVLAATITIFVILAIGYMGFFKSALPELNEQTAQNQELTTFNYGKYKKSCIQWTDSCHICKGSMCSTASIACIQKEVTCISGSAPNR
jgi:hypothetical protein